MRLMIGNKCVSVRNCPHDMFSRGTAGRAREEKGDCSVLQFQYTFKGILHSSLDTELDIMN